MENKYSTVKKYSILTILVIGAILALLNQSLMNTALPVIMKNLSLSANTAQWLSTGFMLANGITIPITAFLVLRFSTKKLFLMTISLFVAGTVICAIAPNFSLLLLGRILQAISAGIILPLAQGVLFVIFPAEERGFAMGIVGLAAAFAPAIGPVLSGWIVQSYSWRILFYALIPLILLDLIGGVFLVENVTKQEKTKIDILSVLLSSLGCGGLMYSFSKLGKGMLGTTVIIALLVGAISIVLFIWRQLILEKPLLELKVFKNRTFTLSTMLCMIVTFSMLSAQLLMPLYIQNMLKFSPMATGLMLMPGAIVSGIMSPIIGKIFDKIGARPLAIAGMSITTVSTFLLTFLTPSSSRIFVIVVYMILMFGLSLVLMPVFTAGLNHLPQTLTPHGITTNNTTRQIAAAIGTALLVTIMTNSGINMAFIVSTGIAIGGFVISFFMKTVHNDGKTEQQ